MGSSAKKKREKKKDFQKPKLKVGKARPKPANTTSTSFRSKAIVLNQQLSTSAPSTSLQFTQQLSLASSKSDSQRRDALAYLTTYVNSKPVNDDLPIPASAFLPKLYPLVLDGTGSVRAQNLKLLQALGPDVLADHAQALLPYVRAGMTHLAAEIRSSAIEVLLWLLGEAGDEVVSCAGGFVKTMNCFLTVLGWHPKESAKWSTNRASLGRAGSDDRPLARTLIVLSEFLRYGICDAGLVDDVDEAAEARLFPYVHRASHAIPVHSNAYGYLNLFGAQKDDESQMLEDWEDRTNVFVAKFKDSVQGGLATAKQEGGEIGRAAALVTKVLKDATRAEQGG